MASNPDWSYGKKRNLSKIHCLNGSGFSQLDRRHCDMHYNLSVPLLCPQFYGMPCNWTLQLHGHLLMGKRHYD
jgi:hypothetical protein